MIFFFVRTLILNVKVQCHFSVTQSFSHCCVPHQQIQYNGIQEFHYLPKALLQLDDQYCSIQPRLHAEQQQLQQQARVLTECCMMRLT